MSWSSSKQIWPSYSTFPVCLQLELGPCGADLNPAPKTERREPKQEDPSIVYVSFGESISFGSVFVRGRVESLAGATVACWLVPTLTGLS